MQKPVGIENTYEKQTPLANQPANSPVATTQEVDEEEAEQPEPSAALQVELAVTLVSFWRRNERH